ncbi:oligopeptide/dipeptide ABC transporter, ATPase subunit, partial [mine drainage metagenome]
MINVSNLGVSYSTDSGVAKAITNLSLDVRDGETMGLVGESGSGKSTLGLALMRILPKNAQIVSGSMMVYGNDLMSLSRTRMRRMRGETISMVFQGAMNSLNPLMTVERQVSEPLVIHGKADTNEALEMAHDILRKVGLKASAWMQYPHQLSGGMKQRAVIAMAIITNPKILIADEPTTGLDVVTQMAIVRLLKETQREMKITMIFISHDLPIVAKIADRISIMYGGRLMETGSTNDIIKNPKHPYTSKLLASVPDISGDRIISGIPGEPVSALRLPRGCLFRERCEIALNECSSYNYAEAFEEMDHKAYCI